MAKVARARRTVRTSLAATRPPPFHGLDALSPFQALHTCIDPRTPYLGALLRQRPHRPRSPQMQRRRQIRGPAWRARPAGRLRCHRPPTRRSLASFHAGACGTCCPRPWTQRPPPCSCPLSLAVPTGSARTRAPRTATLGALGRRPRPPPACTWRSWPAAPPPPGRAVAAPAPLHPMQPSTFVPTHSGGE